MVEQLLQGHLEELRVIRENASRQRAERGVGPDGDVDEEGDGGGDEDDDLDLNEIPMPGGLLDSDRPQSNPQARERSRSPPQGYHGMYS